MASTILDFDFFSFYYEFDEIVDVYEELYDNNSTLCELLDFKLYY